MKDIEYYLDNLSFNYKNPDKSGLICCFIITILIIPFLCLFSLICLIILSCKFKLILISIILI